MEEKERFELVEEDFAYAIVDNKEHKTYQCDFFDFGNICDLLNHYFKRIKELEEQTYPAYKREHKRRAYLENIEVPRLKKENEQLEQQLHDSPKKIMEEIKDCLLDFSNGWWRYFMTDGCEYMLSSDLQGCLDEIIDTILKKYGGEDE